MTPEIASLLVRCLAAMNYEDTAPYGSDPGDAALFAEALSAVDPDRLTAGAKWAVGLEKFDLSPYQQAAGNAAFRADPAAWIQKHTVDGIRPHLPSAPERNRPEWDRKREAFEAAFSGYCPDGTCGECGACELRKDGM